MLREANAIVLAIKTLALRGSNGGAVDLATRLLRVVSDIEAAMNLDTMDRAPYEDFLRRMRTRGVDVRDTWDHDKVMRAMARADNGQRIVDELEECALVADACVQPDLAAEIRDAAGDLDRWRKIEYALAHCGPGNPRVIARMLPPLRLSRR